MIFAVGRMVQFAMQAVIELMGKQVYAGVVDARFVKPMDESMLAKCAGSAKLVVTVEENTLMGGFGEGVMDALSRLGIETPVLPLGIPDRFIAHASVSEQMEACGLTPYGIASAVMDRFAGLREAKS